MAKIICNPSVILRGAGAMDWSHSLFRNGTTLRITMKTCDAPGQKGSVCHYTLPMRPFVVCRDPMDSGSKTFTYVGYIAWERQASELVKLDDNGLDEIPPERLQLVQPVWGMYVMSGNSNAYRFICPAETYADALQQMCALTTSDYSVGSLRNSLIEELKSAHYGWGR